MRFKIREYIERRMQKHVFIIPWKETLSILPIRTEETGFQMFKIYIQIIELNHVKS